jgi:hypothetical protein
MSRDFGIFPIPRRLQHAEGQSRHLGLAANLMFGLAAAFTGLSHKIPSLIVLSLISHSGQCLLLPTLTE